MANAIPTKSAEKILSAAMRSFRPAEVLRARAAGRAASQESMASRLRARQDRS